MEETHTSDQPPQLRVGITYNLKKTISSGIPDDEAEYDELSTILAIKDALEGPGCAVELMEATRELPHRLTAGKVDIVFNIAEGAGGRGREAQVPALLNLYGIPFTGSDETTLCIALDKALTKRLLASHRVRTPRYAVIGKDGKRAGSRVPFPAIVKPNAEGSSKGITGLSVVSDAAGLHRLIRENMARYRQDMLVEEYIGGREFTVGVLGNGGDVRIFPPMEIICEKKTGPYGIYSYEVKKDFLNCVRYECPADVGNETHAEIERTARKVYDVLACRDFARIDFRLSPEGVLYFIEINPLPGLAPGYSDFPILAEKCGVSYRALVRGVLSAALKRYGLQDSL